MERKEKLEGRERGFEKLSSEHHTDSEVMTLHQLMLPAMGVPRTGAINIQSVIEDEFTRSTHSPLNYWLPVDSRGGAAIVFTCKSTDGSIGLQ